MSAPEASAVSSESGRTYEILGELGRGGFGAVFKARHTGEAGFARLVAIKMLLEEGSTRPEYANRLRDEARLLSRLRHRAIVAVDDLVCLDGRWAVVMEYVEGEDLLSLIRRGPIPPRVATEIALEVAGGLRVIHGAKDPSTKRQLGIVHRDLKPSNIRITPHGEVKLLDFGIARAAFPGREAVTGSVRFESVGYVAPERMFGLDTAGSDIFSLGVVLYESLTGLRMGPLPERQGAYETTRDKMLENLREVLPDPGPLRAVLTRMLAFEDKDRPTASLTVELLRDLAQELPGPWLASWAPELLGRSRYGDPEDYAALGADELGPASTESLAVEQVSVQPGPEDEGEEDAADSVSVDDMGPPPTIGLSLPVARPHDVMDALVPAPEDMDDEDPLAATPVSTPAGTPAGTPAATPTEELPVLVEASSADELPPPFSRPSAPPPPPTTRAVPGAAEAAPAPITVSPSIAEGIPPVAGWLLGTAAALLLLGLLGIALIVHYRPDLMSGEGPPTEPLSVDVDVNNTPPVVETPPVETPPVETPPVETPPVVEAPVVEAPPAETPPVEAPPAETPPVSSAQASAEKAGSKTRSGSGARPRTGATAGATATGKVVVRGTYDKAELSSGSTRIPVGSAPPGTWQLRVRFGKDLAWVETGLNVVVVAGQTSVVECSYESEACRISR